MRPAIIPALISVTISNGGMMTQRNATGWLIALEIKYSIKIPTHASTNVMSQKNFGTRLVTIALSGKYAQIARN